MGCSTLPFVFQEKSSQFPPGLQGCNSGVQAGDEQANLELPHPATLGVLKDVTARPIRRLFLPGPWVAAPPCNLQRVEHACHLFCGQCNYSCQLCKELFPVSPESWLPCGNILPSSSWQAIRHTVSTLDGLLAYGKLAGPICLPSINLGLHLPRN